MKRLLHIIATPRGKDSRTLKVAQVFLENFTKKYPACKIDSLDLFAESLPPLTVKIVSGKYVLLGGKDITEKPVKDAWKDVERHIERFMSQDGYLVSTPMWNFSIPYILKQYIDIIIQPKYLFRYTNTGVEGLVKNRKMVVIASRGGDYRPSSPFYKFDFQEPYLRAVFGFVGITDIQFIIAQPMDMGPLLESEAVRDVAIMARKAADVF